MANQDKLSEQQIAELLKKVGPLKEPPADMSARVKASVRETWVEETTSRQTPWAYRAAAAVAVLSIGLVFTLQGRVTLCGTPTAVQRVMLLCDKSIAKTHLCESSLATGATTTTTAATKSLGGKSFRHLGCLSQN